MPRGPRNTDDMSRRLALATSALTIAAVLATSACAASPGYEPVPAPPAPTDVVGQGTVIQTGDDPAQLCLGAIMESYPPQCSGVELEGWDWNTADGQETASGVTWGTYAVWGSWDGATLSVSGSIQLALYDPIRYEDPLLDPDNAGTSGESELASVQERVMLDAPVEILSSRIENGYVFVEVVHDGGAVQDWADETYGEGVVAVRSALRDVS